MSAAPETVRHLIAAVSQLVRTGRHVSARAASVASWQLAVLERAGYVDRRPDPHHARAARSPHPSAPDRTPGDP